MEACMAVRARRAPSRLGRPRRSRPRSRTRTAAGSPGAADRNPIPSRAGRSSSFGWRLSEAACGARELAVSADRDRREGGHRDAERDGLERRDDEIRHSNARHEAEADAERSTQNQQRACISDDEQRDAEHDLEYRRGDDERRCERRGHADLRGEVDLARARHELGDDAVVKPDECEREARDPMDRAPLQAEGRIDATLEPETQTVEAPRGRPAEDGTEQEIRETPDGAEAGLVVVEGDEPDAPIRRGVAPVARSLPDERLGVVGPETKRGGAVTVAIARADALSLAGDAQAEADPRRVEEALRILLARTREVADLGEPKIPPLVSFRPLRRVPERLHRCPYEPLDVDRSAHRADSRLARSVFRVRRRSNRDVPSRSSCRRSDPRCARRRSDHPGGGWRGDARASRVP